DDRCRLQAVHIDHEPGQLGVERSAYAVASSEAGGRIRLEERAPRARSDPAGQRSRVGPQPHHPAGRPDQVAVVGIEHGPTGHRHHQRSRSAQRILEGTRLLSAEGRFPALGEDLGNRPSGPRLDLGIAVEVVATQPGRQPPAHCRLARAHHPDQENALGSTHPPCWSGSEARYPSRLRSSSVTESPPNLRSASPASTSATIVSATTPMAGTAVTSVRSLNETVSSLVTTSTVLGTGRLSVASGFMPTRTDRSDPVDMPPSLPPARSVSRTYRPPSASQEMASWAS